MQGMPIMMGRNESPSPRMEAVCVGAGLGRIGIVISPGAAGQPVRQETSGTDLATALDAMRDWGAGVVVSLVDASDRGPADASDWAAAVRRRHMEGLQLPVPDLPAPGSAFEILWKLHGEGLRARLRSGFDVVVHHDDGFAHAGLIAARLLVELGHESDIAIDKVERLWPGAIEVGAWQCHVLAGRAIPEPEPDTSLAAIRDRAIGAMLGLAVGDAIGTTLEFETRDSYEPLDDMVGGGPFDLKPGEWTDDTAMALALASSLVECGGLDEADLLTRFTDWYRNGTYSCTGTCFDIGGTTAYALQRWEATGELFPGSTDPRTAGNGSLMRLAPIVVRHWSDRVALRDAAARQSRTTHGAPEAIDACVAYAEILADAIEGRPRSQVLSPRGEGYAGAIARIVGGSWRGRLRRLVWSSGYVAHSLEASLWSVGRTSDFRSAVLTAANLGVDADTTAAITGQLAGALCGAAAIPVGFLDRLAWRDRIETLAGRLFDASLNSGDFAAR